MSGEITLVDRGRGLQLSTSRVRVQDLVPYFQEELSHDEIRRWIPTLSLAEIEIVERYYGEHKEELDAEDRLIEEASAQRRNPEWVEKIMAEGRAKRLALTEQLRQAEQLRQERNGNAQ